MLATAGGTVAAVMLQLDAIGDPLREQPAIRGLPAREPPKPGAPQTLLLLGSDHRFADDTGPDPATGFKRQLNADTMLLVRLDADAPATTVMSIPRDTRVTVPGHGVQKINAAFGLGGPALSLRTLQRLLGIDIDHVFVTTFTAFSRAVDAIGCVYSDVDHRYYVPPNSGYAAIDLRAGYQKLCGEDALSFVRFRHADTDLVRAARQQAFLRAAAQQVRATGLIRNSRRLVRLIASYTQTDVRSTRQIYRLLRLAAFSAGNPVSQVPFPGILPEDPGDSYVYYDEDRLEAAVRRFEDPPAAKPKVPAARRARRRGEGGARPVPLDPLPPQAGAAQALRARVGFPVYYLESAVPGARLAGADAPRAYSIRDGDGRRHAAYRWTFDAGAPGEYYGLQGTTWSDPPMLEEATGEIDGPGGKALLATSGGRITWIAWRRKRSVYWITNTLTRRLSNKQMVGLLDAVRR